MARPSPMILQDFLGRLIGDADWVRNTERAMFDVFDHNFFCNRVPINMFTEVFKDTGKYLGLNPDPKRKIFIGWSHGIYGTQH